MIPNAVRSAGQTPLLIAVYATNMADQIAANIKAVNRYVSSEIDASADELAAQLKEMERAGE